MTYFCNKNTIIILFILITILVAGCSSNLSSQKKEEILSQEFVAFCEGWGGNFGNLCLSEAAPYQKDISICDKIQGGLLADDYKTKCIQNVAFETQDISLCGKIPEQGAWNKQMECIFEVVRQNLDIAICKDVLNEKIKDECYSTIGREKQDIIICDNILDPQVKDECYRYVAQSKNDINICKKIQDNFEKNICFSNIASGTSDPSICENIKQADMIKEQCYDNVV